MQIFCEFFAEFFAELMANGVIFLLRISCRSLLCRPRLDRSHRVVVNPASGSE